MKFSLFPGPEARQIDELDGALRLLIRLANLKWTQEDWAQFQTEKERFRPWIFEAFLQGLGDSGQEINGLKVSAFQAKGKIEFSFVPSLRFYEIAVDRDRAFVENLETLMKEKNSDLALFLAGGFHTVGVTARLKAQNISYLVISPKIASPPAETTYARQMSGEVSWKSYLRIENGEVDLFDAFWRATRDRLDGKQFAPDPAAGFGPARHAAMQPLAVGSAIKGTHISAAALPAIAVKPQDPGLTGPLPKMNSSLSIALHPLLLPEDETRLQRIAAVVIYPEDPANHVLLPYSNDGERAAAENFSRAVKGPGKIRLVSVLPAPGEKIRLADIRGKDFFAVMPRGRTLVSRENVRIAYEIDREVAGVLEDILPVLWRIASAPEELRERYLQEFRIEHDAASGVYRITQDFLNRLSELAEYAREFATAA